MLIGITNEIPEHDEKYEMHRLIGTLLSDKKNGNGWAVIEKEGSEINNDAFIDPNDTVED